MTTSIPVRLALLSLCFFACDESRGPPPPARLPQTAAGTVPRGEAIRERPEAKPGDWVEYEISGSSSGFGGREAWSGVVRFTLVASEGSAATYEIRAIRGGTGVLFARVATGIDPFHKRVSRRERVTEEERTISGKSYTARVRTFDESPGDGPKGESVQVRGEPGLALVDGVISAKQSSGGRGGSGSASLRLVRFGDGSAPSAPEASAIIDAKDAFLMRLPPSVLDVTTSPRSWGQEDY